MQGEIGALYQGKQIGGFLDWTLDLRLFGSQSPDGAVYKVSMVKASASKFWLLYEPTDGEITANFYQLIKDRLVLINSHIITADLIVDINKMINRPLVMTWKA
jgi:hypothetical protein